LLQIHLNIKNIRQFFSKICFFVSNYVGTTVSLLSEARVCESFITEPSIVLACALASGHRWMKCPLAVCCMQRHLSGSSFSPSFLLPVSLMASWAGWDRGLCVTFLHWK